MYTATSNSKLISQAFSATPGFIIRNTNTVYAFILHILTKTKAVCFILNSLYCPKLMFIPASGFAVGKPAFQSVDLDSIPLLSHTKGVRNATFSFLRGDQ